MTIYLCAVSSRFPENYQIGVHAKCWGVEERYKHRIALAMPGDTLVFLLGGQYRSIHTIESTSFVDHTPLWPEKDGDYFPHRVKISAPSFVGTVSASRLATSISFMKGKAWGGTIQGASGVFNDRLSSADIELIRSQMRPATASMPKPLPPLQEKRPNERQQALFRFYETEVEERLLDCLSSLGLKLFCDPSSGRDGRQFVIEKGRIDLLCEDIDSGALVVIELKKGEAPEQALLQVLRYMSWVRQHIAAGRDVKGIILTESADTVLSQVVFDVPNVSIRYYRVSIDLLPAGLPDQRGGTLDMTYQQRLLQ